MRNSRSKKNITHFVEISDHLRSDNDMYIMVRSKVTSLYLQNPRKKLILGFKMILNTSLISLAVSITSGKYSATFSMSLQLLTPSELGDRSIFVPGEHVRKWKLKINVGGVSSSDTAGFLSKIQENR